MNNQSVLVNLAAFVIVCAGLSAATSIVVPFFLAIFISIALTPILDLFARVHVRRIFAILILVFIFFELLWFLGNIIFSAINNLSTDLPVYRDKFAFSMAQAIEWLNSHNIKVSSVVIDTVDPDKIFSTASSFLRQTGDIVTKSFLVLLFVIFMLVDVSIFADKVKYFSIRYPQATVIVNNFIANLKRYIVIKTISSIATALILYPILLHFNVPYAMLWALLAFILNYIPTIGSIIAAFPAIMLSLLLNDFSDALWVSGAYLVVNIAIGNFIEPRFLGSSLGISTLVVILSLIFWGFLLGIGGMFMAVPLTMSVKIALNESKKTKFISILLSDKKE
nr:AI-2E family transporter [Campylobacter sp.]